MIVNVNAKFASSETVTLSIKLVTSPLETTNKYQKENNGFICIRYTFTK